MAKLVVRNSSDKSVEWGGDAGGARHYLAFDIGGTHVKYALLTLAKDGVVHISDDWRGSFDTPRRRSRQAELQAGSQSGLSQSGLSQAELLQAELIGKMVDIVKSVEGGAGVRISGIPVSAPGIIDSAECVFLTSGAVTCLTGANLCNVLGGKLLEELGRSIPISLENDANCAILSEVWAGNLKDTELTLFVTLGTGIGGAIVYGNTLHRGKNFYGGEFHDLHVPLGESGSYNFAEPYGWGFHASTIALVEKARLKLSDVLGRGFRDEDSQGLSGKSIFAMLDAYDVLDSFDGNLSDSDFRAYVSGRAIASVVDRWYVDLAKGLIFLQEQFDPHRIVIGGGVVSRERFLLEVRTAVRGEEPEKWQTPEVGIATYGSDAQLLGALYHFLAKR